MERLKAALDKARAQRGAGGVAAPRVAPNSLRKTRSGPPADADVDAAWEAVPALPLDLKRLVRRRVFVESALHEGAAYDVLRTKVLQLTGAQEWKRIAVTSPLPAAGKTTTTVNLALALARQTDLRIILMELDLRRPSMARLLGAPPADGVLDVLRDKVPFSEQARRVGDNLLISIGHTSTRDPSDTFLRQRTSDIIDEIEADYHPDLMLFDLPPMLVNDDTSSVLGRVDCALMVAEADVTTISQVDTCEKELAEQTNVLGVVLNKCRFRSDGYAHYTYKYR